MKRPGFSTASRLKSAQKAAEKRKAGIVRVRCPSSKSALQRPRTLRNGISGKAGKRLKAKPDANLAAWGRRVRARDRNICRYPIGCASGDNRIDPHHIAPRSQRPDLSYIDSNGICLCRWHHDWVHANPLQARAKGLLSGRTMELAAKENTIGIR